jgi:hypothetical protein
LRTGGSISDICFRSVHPSVTVDLIHRPHHETDAGGDVVVPVPIPSEVPLLTS